MLWQVIISGLVLGIVSSLHCAGMCGPLVLTLPIQHLSKDKQVLSVFLYHVGRIITYSALGLILGIAGRSIYMAGFQQWFSIITGTIILFFTIEYWMFRRSMQPSFISKFYYRVQNLMITILQKNNTAAFALFGMVNGLLPCGMVYAALAGALVSGEVKSGIVFMAMFGAGTLPLMFAVTWFGQKINVAVRNQFRKVVPVFISIMAVILILRGMNLGIPFISPVLHQAGSSTMVCH